MPQLTSVQNDEADGRAENLTNKHAFVIETRSRLAIVKVHQV